MDYPELNDEEFLEQVDTGRIERFGHREHLRLAFLAAQSCDGLDEMIDRCRTGIRRVATARGAPDRYDEGITAAWARVVREIVLADPDATFDDLLAERPEIRRP